MRAPSPLPRFIHVYSRWRFPHELYKLYNYHITKIRPCLVHFGINHGDLGLGDLHFRNTTILVGGLEHDFYDFPYIENNTPNWRTHIFQRGRAQPPTSIDGDFFRHQRMMSRFLGLNLFDDLIQTKGSHQRRRHTLSSRYWISSNRNTKHVYIWYLYICWCT